MTTEEKIEEYEKGKIEEYEKRMGLYQNEINRLKAKLKEEKPKPKYPPGTRVWEERRIVRYSKASPAGAPYLTESVCEDNTSFADCFTSARHLRPFIQDEPTVLYEEGKVFYSKDQGRVFVLTGKLVSQRIGWYMIARLYPPKSESFRCSYPEARILDVPVYKFEGDMYIHDGGPKRMVKKGDMFINLCGDTDLAKMGIVGFGRDVDNGKRLILVKLQTVE